MVIMIMHREKGTRGKLLSPKITAFICGIIFFLFLSGCGQENLQAEQYYNSKTEIISSEYDFYFMDRKVKEDIVFYGVNYDICRNEYIGNIICYNSETKKSRLCEIDISSSIQDFRIADEKIYILIQSDKYNYEIQCFDFEGHFLKKIVLGNNANINNVYFWDIDKEENILIIDAENKLFLFRSNVSQKEYITDFKENILSAYITGDNQFVYLCNNQKGETEICQIDYLYKKEKKVILNDPNILKYCFGIFEGENGCVLINGENALYKLDIQNGKVDFVLDWMDLSVDNSVLCDIEEKGENYYVCSTRQEEEKEIFELVKIYLENGYNDREVIEAASIYSNQEIKRAIIDFNKQHSDIKIHLTTFNNGENADEQFEKLINKLNAGDGIDIVITDSCYYKTLVDRGMLAELDTYMINDNFDNKLISSVIDAYRVNHQIYAIMDRFEVYTVLGRKEVFQSDRTYTISELLNVASKEKTTLYNCNTKTDNLYDLFILNDDKENYEKLSDSDIKDILKITGNAPPEFISYEKDALLEKVVLKQNYYIWFELFRAGHNDDFSMIGYPCEKNMGTGAMFDVPCLYSISAKSKNKDQAWIFIREMLEDDRQEAITDDFPISKKVFETKLQRSLKVSDESERVVYIIGDTQIEARLGEISESDIERVKKCVYESNQYYYMDKDFFNIIREESESFYTGQKTAEEVIAVINNRLNIYFHENAY